MDDMKEALQEVQGTIGKLSEEYPELMKSFHNFMETVEKDGALPHKQKELISLGIAIAKQCKWCIAFHVENCMKADATKDEIMETCFVAALMGGGPALMYVQLAVKAMQDLGQ